MSQPNPAGAAHAFTGAIPPIYHRHLGPVIFTPYAEDMAARTRFGQQARVLEVACGTGIVTDRLLVRLPAGGRLVATDLNPAMVEHARARVAKDARLELRVADAQQLPFDAGAFDHVDRPASAVSAADFAIGVVRGNPIAVAIQERLGDAHERIIATVAAELAKAGGASPWRGKLRALVVRATR